MNRIPALALAAAVFAACGPAGQPPKDPVFYRQDAVTTVCGSTSIKGIDVSSWQGTINWDSVANSGLKFAIARISDGSGYSDSQFSRNWSEMKRVGMIRGAYQFFEPGQSASAQANLVVSAVGHLGAGDLPVTIDVETGSPTASEINTWASIVEQGTGKKPMIYTAYGLWNGWFPNGGLEAYPLWAANYGVTCPGMPNHWSNWTFWQYADNTSVPGISGSVDGDYFNGSYAELQAFAGADSCNGQPDGYYCGGHGINGDPGTLYRCSSNQATPEEVCTGWCATGPNDDFCARHHKPARGPDLDGDGKADLCARTAGGIDCWTSGSAPFATAVAGPGLSDASGWAGIQYFTTIQLADVNGDHRADLCARGAAGAMCWLNDGHGTFATATAQGPMTDAAGWNKPEYRTTIQWADVNGDGKADVCGRAYASFSCWLYDGTGFTQQVDAPDMGDPQGWNVPQYYGTIVTADVNGDGKADVCARGWGGFECWLSTGSGFNPAGGYVDAFSDPNGGDAVSVYSTLQLGDIDGDGKLDVCGRTHGGYVCAKGDGTGQFPTIVQGPDLSDAQGWNGAPYFTSIQLADINGDGKADVCGRGIAGVSCWLSDGNGFPTAITGPALADSSGWGHGVYASTLQFADIDGDHRADLCARAAAGWMCWTSTGTGFSSTPTTLPDLSDSAGFTHPEYLETIELAGSAFGIYTAPSTTSGSTSSGSTTTTGSSTSSSSSSGSTSGSTGTGSTTGSTTTTGGSTGTGSTTGGSTGSTSSGSTGTSTQPPVALGGSSGSGTSGSQASLTGKSTAHGGCSSAGGGELLGLLALAGLALRKKR